MEGDLPEHPEKLHDFGIFGSGRPEQGVALWSALVSRILAGNPGVKILMQSPAGAQGDALREIAGKKDLSGRITLFASGNADDDYLRRMMGCRVILIPYDPAYYGLRSSMVFYEAAYLGIPVVAHSRTPMGRMILSGIASGVTYERQDREAITNAAMSALEHLPELSKRAVLLRDMWRSRLSVSTLLGQLCSAFSA